MSGELPFGLQVGLLFVLALPVAAISWTVTHEDVFRELREWFMRRSRRSRTLVVRKFFYLFTCEYCFSHYVTIGILALTQFRLWLPGWRGYFLAGFALVWIANIYMSLFGRLRLDIRHERLEIEAVATEVAAEKQPSDLGSDRGS